MAFRGTGRASGGSGPGPRARGARAVFAAVLAASAAAAAPEEEGAGGLDVHEPAYDGDPEPPGDGTGGDGNGVVRTTYLPGGLFLPGGNSVPDFVVEGSAFPGVPFAVDLFGLPAVVHVEAPPGTALSLDLRRTSGSLPEVLAVADAEGRVLTPRVRRRVSGRVSFAEVPVRAEGGVDVLLLPVRTVRAAATVHASVRALLPDERLASELPPWEPARFVVSGGDGADPETVAESLGGVFAGSFGESFAMWCDPARAGLEWFDAEAYLRLLGPGWYVEVDPYAEPPEGSQSNALIVASEFGRSFLRQTALRMVAVPPLPRPPDGAGVVIAVLDTGIDARHPWFLGRLLPGIDLVDGDEDPSEEHADADRDLDGDVDESFGHGTVVAGVAALVAPGAKILPIRILDPDGRAPATRVAEGLRHAIERGAHVVNLSLGMRAWSSALDEAVREAVDAGVLVVVAAGNDGDRFAVDFPGDVPGVIAATALGVRGRRAAYGNGRRAATVLAPGSRIIGPYPGTNWAMGTGTSFAAPIVAGAAARFRQIDPAGDARTFQKLLAPRSRLDLRALWR